ncbi:sensor histidine kinase [Sanguibacter sp. HDW7]|uniref:sensor histidine kinase n=1 Tax=Sanguibacter sp. HDW7 TaxID=2714931 RepID=UPI00140BE1DE|nr:sensor histidine kinase [Sanguibacter sp. HDW7]QIK84422.1 sensor histidine kinase [Sanguibacter sp. HDW7]
MNTETRRGRVAGASIYTLTSLPLTVFSFSLVLTGLTAGIGLAVVWVGVPLLAATLVGARGLAQLERVRLRRLLGDDVPPARYLRPGPDDSRVRRALLPLRDPQAWLDALWSIVALVTSLVAFTLTVTWWALTLGGLTYWFWQGWLPDLDGTLAGLLGLGDGRTMASLVNLAVGVVALVTLPWVVRGSARLHAGLATLLLTTRGTLESDVDRVEVARSSATAAEAAQLRRLERDIHDGPQQRLVRLQMDLGRARTHLAEDPERAAEALESAVRQATDTLDELRALSRGIAPPLLVDRGLAVAIDDLASRATVPVHVDVNLPGRPDPVVEQTAYFVVSEALTNVAKHSGATRAQVTLQVAGDALYVDVLDDGVGGAHPAKGTGLAGLARRLEGARGTLTIDSPEGGPTVLRAVVPWRAG